MELEGLTSDAVGDIALANGIAIHELVPQHASLEQAFMRLTQDAVEYPTAERSAS